MERTPAEDLVVSGLTDWADVGWVYGSVVAGFSERHAVRQVIAIGVIAQVLVGGFMVAGDAMSGTHHPWRCSPGEAVERITREVLAVWSAKGPTPGSIAWLDNTAMGDDIGRSVLAREGSTD